MPKRAVILAVGLIGVGPLMAQPTAFDLVTAEIRSEAPATALTWVADGDGFLRRGMESAVRALRQGRAAAAQCALGELRLRSPTDASIRWLEAHVHGLLGERGKAREALKAAVRLDPRFGEAWRDLAGRCLDERRWKEASAALERARALLPDDPWTRARRAQWLLGSGRYEEAIQEVTEARRARPGSAALAALQEDLARIAESPLWESHVVIEGRRFRLESDLGPEASGRALAHVEKFCAVLELILPMPAPRGGRARIYLFGDRADYESYVAPFGGTCSRSRGLYCVPTRTIIVHAEADPAETLTTLRHEAVHHHFASLAPVLPPALSEDLAEKLSAAR